MCYKGVTVSGTQVHPASPERCSPLVSPAVGRHGGCCQLPGTHPGCVTHCERLWPATLFFHEAALHAGRQHGPKHTTHRPARCLRSHRARLPGGSTQTPTAGDLCRAPTTWRRRCWHISSACFGSWLLRATLRGSAGPIPAQPARQISVQTPLGPSPGLSATPCPVATCPSPSHPLFLRHTAPPREVTLLPLPGGPFAALPTTRLLHTLLFSSPRVRDPCLPPCPRESPSGRKFSDLSAWPSRDPCPSHLLPQRLLPGPAGQSPSLTRLGATFKWRLQLSWGPNTSPHR